MSIQADTPQTESHTPSENAVMVDMDTGKITEGPVFELKPSDISAALTIDFWSLCQTRIAVSIAKGQTPEQAVHTLRTTFGIPPYVPDIWHTEKLRSASRIAREMEKVEGRRLAD